MSYVSIETRRPFIHRQLIEAITNARQNPIPLFVICCLTIVGIGILDTWLVIQFSSSIEQLEQNPICLYLINLDPDRMMLFIWGKTLGIATVVCTLVGLLTFWKKVAMPITFAITLFQIGLLSYLYILSDFSHFCRVYLKM